MASRDRGRDAERLLKRLARRGAHPTKADPEIVDDLIARDLIHRDGGLLRLTAAGRTHLRRGLCGENQFADQHRTLETTVIDDDVLGRQSVLINTDESPLARLRRTKGRNGKPLVSDAEFVAGERLRSDFTRARLMLRVTASWSATVAAGRRDGGGMADITDAAIAARQRVERAMGAVGPDFAGLLVDFCCFLKGVEEIEKDRSWPARSAKLVVRLALASLARHYGMSENGRASASTGRIRHWRTSDYRPEPDPED